jgi:hypothetical protein
VVTHLEPLAIASNLTQAENTRLDHVLLTLGNLFRIYDNVDETDHDVKEGIQASLEIRWAKADQDAFILAVFLTPYIRADLFNRKIIQFTPAGIYGIVKHMYKRVFREEPDFDLHAACMDCYKCREEFSDDAMHLNDLEAAAKADVSALCCQTTLVCSPHH